MRRLVAVLADTPHRYIVSKGPQHADYELAPNMWGAEFLPQTSIAAARRPRDHPRRQQHDDRVFHFGKPMIVLPLFWDQYDNAQRVDETGFGARLGPTRSPMMRLRGAIDRLLGDAGSAAAARAVAARRQASPAPARPPT